MSLFTLSKKRRQAYSNADVTVSLQRMFLICIFMGFSLSYLSSSLFMVECLKDKRIREVHGNYSVSVCMYDSVKEHTGNQG